MVPSRTINTSPTLYRALVSRTYSVAAAVQSDWDRDFTSNDKIKGWLLEQVQRVPFDPARVSLLDYVKSRMQAAEAQQKQQSQTQQAPPSHDAENQQQQPQIQQQSQTQPQYAQQQAGYQQQQQQSYGQQQQQYFQQQRQQVSKSIQQQSSAAPAFSQQPFGTATPASNSNASFSNPQASSSSSRPSSSTQIASNGVSYTVLSDDDDSSGQEMEEDQQYEFGLDDIADTNTNKASSPLPPPLAQQQQPTQSQASTSAIFPYATGHPSDSVPSSQPFLQARPAAPPTTQSHYHHAALPISQPATLNPALLFTNNSQARQQQQFQQQNITPHQLSQSQPISYQVNGISLALQPSTSTAVAQAQASASSSNAPATDNGKAKRKTEVEVVVPQRREGSATASAKRKKTSNSSTSDSSRQPLSATAVSGQQKPKAGPSSTATQSSASGQPLPSILSVTVNTSQPPSKAQKEWSEIRTEMERTLHQATRSPHKTVMKMFKLLQPFVSEPPDATSRHGSREAFITDLRVPAEARLSILETINHDTNDDFDVIFVVDPRATTLLHEWTKDLALIAKGKYNGPEPAEEIKKTSRSLLAVSGFSFSLFLLSLSPLSFFSMLFRPILGSLVARPCDACIAGMHF